jgi:hypothetical protein
VIDPRGWTEVPARPGFEYRGHPRGVELRKAGESGVVRYSDEEFEEWRAVERTDLSL